jgi:acetylornithine/succinyldiaminopimelate/putrescine aminotransferase
MDEAFLADVRAKSAYVFQALKGAKGVESVSGLGLMIGIKTEKPAAEVLNSPDIVEAAHLKETSLYHLSALCGITDAQEFTRRFIARDREVRK